MDEYDIPDECINDPHFVQVLTATLTAENAANEKLLRDYREGVRQLKATVSREVENRKNIKQQIQDIKQRNVLMEPLLEHLTQSECKRTTEVALLKNQLDDRSLRQQAHRDKYKKILDTYEETWKKYEAEYEEFEFAIIRKQCRIELEKLKIQHMMKQHKKLEYHKMLKQREKIDEKRIQSRIISSAKMMLDGWEKQKCLDVLNGKIMNEQDELEMLEQKYRKMQKYSETEAETKALARRKMPLPRLNIPLVESLYVSRNSHSRFKKNLAPLKPGIDSDTISVNTIMFEEMCNNEENVMSNTICENHEDDEGENGSSSPMQQTTDRAPSPNHQKKVEPESNVEILENICSQLSINEETCNNMHQTKETEEIRDQPTPETHSELQPSQAQFCVKEANLLKHKLATSGGLNANEDEPQQKQPRMLESTEHASLLSTPLSTTNNPCDETCSTAKNSSGNEQLAPSSKTESLPQIRRIETITRPVTVQMKPPMAEVPPTPSSLFSPRHYAPSYASSENLSHYCDNNYNDPLQAGICGVDDYTDNWQNLSPPQAGSEISFSSTHVPSKESANNNVSFFPSQTEKPAPNFFSFLNAGSTNPKSFI